jgi:hypothetical protein
MADLLHGASSAKCTTAIPGRSVHASRHPFHFKGLSADAEPVDLFFESVDGIGRTTAEAAQDAGPGGPEVVSDVRVHDFFLLLKKSDRIDRPRVPENPCPAFRPLPGALLGTVATWRSFIQDQISRFNQQCFENSSLAHRDSGLAPHVFRGTAMETLINSGFVVPAEAGTQQIKLLDARLRGHDEYKRLPIGNAYRPDWDNQIGPGRGVH